jgi:hypothetical protein
MTTLLGDPASVSGAGLGTTGSVSLTPGTLSLSASVAAPTLWAQAYAGVDKGPNGSDAGFTRLQLFNPGPVTVFPPGLKLSFHGTYSFGGGSNAQPNAHSYVLMAITVGSTIAQASMDHIVYATYNAAGSLINTSSQLTPGSTGGASVVVLSATTSGISEDVVMPGFTWPVGAPLTLIVRAACSVTSAHGSATADFSHTGTLTFSVPPGVTLTSNAGVPLNWVTPTLGVGDGPAPVADFAAPWPNPASSGVNLSLMLPSEGHATLEAYDLGGRRVASVIDETLPAGRTQRTWKPAGLANGVYLLRADVGGRVVTHRVAWLGGDPVGL